jgi:hypothetical protein
MLAPVESLLQVQGLILHDFDRRIHTVMHAARSRVQAETCREEAIELETVARDGVRYAA